MSKKLKRKESRVLFQAIIKFTRLAKEMYPTSLKSTFFQ